MTSYQLMCYDAERVAHVTRARGLPRWLMLILFDCRRWGALR